MRLNASLKDFAWERYYDLSSSEIGELIRFPKMGRALNRGGEMGKQKRWERKVKGAVTLRQDDS